MSDETPEEVTMKDLWQHISGLKGEIQGVETRLKEEIQEVRSEVKSGFAELKGETQAVREVVDTLASQEDFENLDRKIAVVANDTKATRADVRNLKAEVSRLKSAVKDAGIPVR